MLRSIHRKLGLVVVLGAAFGPIRCLPVAAAAEHEVSDKGQGPRIAAASDEGAEAIRNFRIPKGWKVDLIAAEPDLANPVAFAFDEQERIHVVETFRHSEGVLDIRGRTGWPSDGYKKGMPPEWRSRMADELLDADLACRSVEDRERMLRHYFAENAPSLERLSERVRQIRRGADGRATGSTVFADGFNLLVGGLASGVLARDGEVWFTDIPNLWKLKDTDGDGVSDERTILNTGFGVRVGFLGHDLHGLRFGPDGRLYFTIGDRGANVVTREGRRLETPDTGAVFRCDPDGSNLEIFATGLRNPQELVFDALGNLWTGDNNSDGGDQARWTYLVEGGDCGWHIGWQFIESPNARGPWNSEGMWRPAEAAKIGYLIPPLANIGAGPSGITFNPGVGLPADMAGRFLMTDFRGGPSGIWSISVEAKGAGYAVAEAKELIWNILPTDVEVGPDGGLYWTDWVQGWSKPGKGRIYRAYDPAVVDQPIVAETRRLLGPRGLPELGPGGPRVAGSEWARLLAHPDQRVRQKVQFALVEQGRNDLLGAVLVAGTDRYSRLHAVWGLGQLARTKPGILRPVVEALKDADPEVRGQAAKVVGEARLARVRRDLERLLSDPEPRPRFFAAIALGQLADSRSAAPLIGMLRESADRDPYLRHAGVMGLVTTLTAPELAGLSDDPSPAVRRAAVVALRRQRSPHLANFLGDSDPSVVLEAARAIHDLPVDGALPALAAMANRKGMEAPLARRVLSANRRVGTATQAEALADFATRETVAEEFRVEALRHLAVFAEPPGRDAVTGLWRPVGRREPGPARAALEARFSALLKGPSLVVAGAVSAAGSLDVRSVAPEIRALARNAEARPSVRRAAIGVLGNWRDEALESVLAEVSRDPEEAVRAEGLRWQTRLGIGDVFAPIQRALEEGSIGEKQGALSNLGAMKSETADVWIERWLDLATAGRAPAEVELEILEAARDRDSARVVAALGRFESALASTNAVQARRYLLRGGDAAEGRKVFYQKEAVQCLRCHKAGGDGGLVGPDLGKIGAEKTREYILDAILEPNAFVAQGFENVMIETNDGEEFAGTLQSESATEVVLNTPDAGVRTVKKSDIADRRRGLSSMPEGLAEILTPRELRDLVEFLAELKGR
ncbi:MAG: HEAT repeat domain-containing protein [Limisphaerales bacterium]